MVISFLTVSAATLSSLTLSPTQSVASVFEFSLLGPALSFFRNLTTLSLTNCHITPHSTNSWLKPTFQLTHLELSASPSGRGSELAVGDLKWLIGSSRYSLHTLTLSVAKREVLVVVGERGNTLEQLNLLLAGGAFEGDHGLVLVLASLPRMQRLVLTLATGTQDEEAALFKAATQANNKLGRTVVSVRTTPSPSESTE